MIWSLWAIYCVHYYTLKQPLKFPQHSLKITHKSIPAGQGEQVRASVDIEDAKKLSEQQMIKRLDQLMVQLKLIKDQTISARHCKPSPMKTILLRLMNLVKMTTAESHNQGWQALQAQATAKGLYLLYPGLRPTQQAVHLSHLIAISSLLHILRRPTLQPWKLSSLCTRTGLWLSVHSSQLLYQSCCSLQTTMSTHTHSLSPTTVRCCTVLYTVPAFEPSSLQLQPLWPKWVLFLKITLENLLPVEGNKLSNSTA